MKKNDKKNVFVIAMVISLILIGSTAFAGSASQSSISTVHFMENGVVLFYIDTNHVNAPSCATYATRFAISGTTAGGKVQLSGLLAAYAMGKRITIYGADICNAYSDTETVSYFYAID